MAASGIDAPQAAASDSYTISASAAAAASSYEYVSPENVFEQIDKDKDGYITRQDFDRAIAAGSLVVEEEAPQDSWIDSLGRTVFSNSPVAETEAPTVVLAESEVQKGSRSGMTITTTTTTGGVAGPAAGGAAVISTEGGAAAATSGETVTFTNTEGGAGMATYGETRYGSSAYPPGSAVLPPNPGAASADPAASNGEVVYYQTSGQGAAGNAQASVQLHGTGPVQPEMSPWGAAGTGPNASASWGAAGAGPSAGASFAAGGGGSVGVAAGGGSFEAGGGRVGYEAGAGSYGAGGGSYGAVDSRYGTGAVDGRDSGATYGYRGNLCHYIMNGLMYRMGLEKGPSLHANVKNNQLDKFMAHKRNVWVFVGLFVILLLVYLPIWNAERLLSDPAYTYFAGRVIPRGILSVCISLPIFYVCTVSLLFKRAPLHVINEQTLLGVGTLFLVILGFSLVLFSFPLTFAALTTRQTLAVDCHTGIKSRELYQTSQALQVLRQDPSCAAEFSVASCAGFQGTEYADVLQQMEVTYRCSGFCYSSSAVASAATPIEAVKASLLQVPKAAAQASLLQTSSEQHSHDGQRVRQKSEGHPALGVAEPVRPAPIVVKQESTVASAGAGTDERTAREVRAINELDSRNLISVKADSKAHSSSTASAAASKTDRVWPGDDVLDAGWAGGYPGGITQWAQGEPNAATIPAQVAADPNAASLPQTVQDVFGRFGMNNTAISPYAPTLFSTLNWKASCDGMAANAMYHGAGDVANTFFYQGVFLMFFSLLIGFMQLLGMCYIPKYSF